MRFGVNAAKLDLTQKRKGAEQKTQRDLFFNSEFSRCFHFQFLKVTD
jgi:hypothetical protein